MAFYDTHCHIHDTTAFPEPLAVLDRAREAGVIRFNVVGVNPADWHVALAFADRHEGVSAIIGWHPNYCADYDPATLTELASLLRHPKVVGIGEMGLDRHWEYSPFDRQLTALQDQLELARDFDLPIIFHVREAFPDFIPILAARGSDRYVVHCYSGTTAELPELLPLGCHFGADGPVTYKKCDDLRAAFAAMPTDRWLLETDSPYMTPFPHRSKPNEPAYVPLIAAALGDGAEAICWDNSIRLFGG